MNLNSKEGLVLVYFCHEMEKASQYCIIFGLLLHERGRGVLPMYYLMI